MIFNIRLCFLLLAVLSPILLLAGGIEGRIMDSEGNPLAFATIYVKQTGSGSTSNENGFYQVKLSPGTYDVYFQFLGFAIEQLHITVGSDFQTKDIVLRPQVYTLEATEISAGKEDPAYTIMRKAIAKSNYHRQQLDSYSCRVYIKGGGRIKDVPFFLRKTLEKEGVDTSATFLSESVSEVKFTRPSTYEEKVISIRTSGDSRNSNPMSFIKGSFYEPEIAEIVSPLSQKAFAYYKFKYINSFTDRGRTVSKIQVIPRSKGEDVVTGYLYIVEDLWSIHSVNMYAYKKGIRIEIRQIYAPVAENVWMPVSHRYNGEGKIFGVEFGFEYLASVSNYEITINPDLKADFEVVDEKINPEKAKDIQEQFNENSTLEDKLESGEEINRKQLKKLLKEYEKQERKENDREYIETEITYEIDSLAYNSDSAYWSAIRPMPLTKSELRGYEVQDSLEVVYQKEQEGDTLSGNGKDDGFNISDLVLGSYYSLGNDNYLRIHQPLTEIHFNTVDGYNFNYRLSYYKRFDKEKRFEFSPLVRYTFSRKKVFGTAFAEYRYGSKYKRGIIHLEGGSFYRQYSPDDVVVPFTNTFASLFFHNNIMKVYDRDYLRASWTIPVTPNISVTPQTLYSQRTETFNTTDQVITPWENRQYDSNAPKHGILGAQTAGWGHSTAFKSGLNLKWFPGRKFYKRNKVEYVANDPPELNFNYTKAISGVADSEIDFDFVSVSAQYRFDLSRFGNLGIRAETGKFLNKGKMEFMDYKHFLGNELPFTRWGVLNGFSLLPFYEYSTNDQYFFTFTNLEFKQLLLTQIVNLRLLGLKEHINFNYLITPDLKNYTEFVYSVTDIFRFGRIDFAVSFENGQYQGFGVQFGISSELFGLGVSDR